MVSIDALLSVDAAAVALGVSAATIRRMCVSGQLAAVKAGRAWLIPESSLAAAQPLSARAGIEDLIDVKGALKRVRQWDLRREVWRPDVLSFADILQSRDLLIEEVRQRLGGTRPHDPPIRSRFPKSPILFRHASDLTLPDRIAYEAVVAAMAPQLDGRLSDAVFNNRWSNRVAVSSVTRPWEEFLAATREAVAEKKGWLIKSDVASYFDFINHRILLDRISASGVNKELVGALGTMLSIWAIRSGEGLPQGPDASRILANFYLAEADEAVQDHDGIAYFRFMDDIRIVASSRSAGAAGLSSFVRELDRVGLPVSSSKTVAFDPEIAAIEVAEDDLRGDDYDRATYWLEQFVGERKALRDDDFETERLIDMFAAAVSERGRLDKRRATYSLYRILDVDSAPTLDLLLSRLEDLAPVADLVAEYLRTRIADSNVCDRIFDYILDDERNVSEYLEHWLLATVVDSGEALSPEQYRALRLRYLDRNRSAGLRGTIASLLVQSGREADVRSVEDDLMSTEDGHFARDLVVALHRVEKLGARVRARVRLRFPGLEPTLTYLAERRELPQMIPRQSRKLWQEKESNGRAAVLEDP